MVVAMEVGGLDVQFWAWFFVDVLSRGCRMKMPSKKLDFDRAYILAVEPSFFHPEGTKRVEC
jgi:hypothetical protein